MITVSERKQRLKCRSDWNVEVWLVMNEIFKSDSTKEARDEWIDDYILIMTSYPMKSIYDCEGALFLSLSLPLFPSYTRIFPNKKLIRLH